MLRVNETRKKLNKAFDKVWSLTDLSSSDLCEISKCSTQNNFSFAALNLNEVDNLSSYFNLSVDRILDGSFCKETLVAQLAGDKLAIPKRYRKNAHSKMFTLRHLYLAAIKKDCGNYLLNHFQITKEALNTDMNISVELPSHVVHKLNLDLDSVKECGGLNPKYLAPTKFGKTLSEAKDVKELMSHWLSVSDCLEENWSYEIERLTKDECILNSYSSELMSDAFKNENFSSLGFTYFRLGSAKAFSEYIGMDDADVTLTKSVHRGDAYDQFHFKYLYH